MEEGKVVCIYCTDNDDDWDYATFPVGKIGRNKLEGRLYTSGSKLKIEIVAEASSMEHSLIDIEIKGAKFCPFCGRKL